MALRFNTIMRALLAGNSTLSVPSFYFNFSNPSNVTLGAAQARGTITSTQNAHITMSASLSRVVGVAPLYVNIDMTGTTSDLTANATHDLFYSVNWGDSDAGQWANGVQSPGLTDKNWSFGPVGGHVFETPGTYLVTPTSTDGVNSAAKPGYVTVLDPDVVYAGTNTICLSHSGNFTGAPSGSLQPVITGNTDMYAHFNTYKGSGKRILFCKADSWTCSAQMGFTNITNMTVGGYGTGVAASFGAGTMVSVSSSYSGSLIYPGTGNTDIKFCNLKIAAGKDTSAIGMYSSITQMLAYKIEIRGCQQGFNAFPGTGGDNHVFDQHCMYECLVDDLWGYAFTDWPTASASGAIGTPGIFTSVAHPFAVGYKVRLTGTPPAPLATLTDYYVSTANLAADTFTLSSSAANAAAGVSLALSGTGTCTVTAQQLNGGVPAFVGFVRGGMMGCYFDNNNAGEQSVRVPFLQRSHMNNNYMARCNQEKNIFKIHSFIYSEVAEYSEKNVISCNVMDMRGGYSASSSTVAHTGYPYISIGNGGAGGDERCRDFIVENNFTYGTLINPKHSQFVAIGGSNMTVRNNIADFSVGDRTTAYTGLYIYSSFNMATVNPSNSEDINGISIYNNTLYSNLVNAEVANFVILDDNPVLGGPYQVTGIAIKNNIWYLPHHNPANTHKTVYHLAAGASPTGVVNTNNTDNNGGISTSPGFVNTPPVALTDWRPTEAWTIDNGTTVPVLRDFNNATRVGGTYDMGAVLP